MFSNPLTRLEESLANNKQMLETIDSDDSGRYPTEFKDYVETNIKQTEKAIKVLKEYEMATKF